MAELPDSRNSPQPDTELIEAFCDQHDKTMEHRRISPPVPEPPSPGILVR